MDGRGGDEKGVRRGGERRDRRREETNLVSEGPDGRYEGSGQTKVGNLEAPIPGHEDVLGLEVAVHHASDVAVLKAAQKLVSVRLNELPRQRALARLEVFFEILVDKLEDEVQAPLALHHVVKLDDVRVS